MEKIERLQQIINRCDRLVFFGGAGVSTESGIPDFRSVDGLYHQKYEYPPETILSHSFFMRHPEEFFRFYREKMLVLDAAPNAAHKKLAELEQAGKLKAVVTQNIDGLHQAAHGNYVHGINNAVPDTGITGKASACAPPVAEGLGADGVGPVIVYGAQRGSAGINGRRKSGDYLECGTRLAVYVAGAV